MKELTLTTLALLASLLAIPPLSAQTYTVPWHTIGPGGVSTGGIYSVRSSVGHWDAGQISGGNLSIGSGFWALPDAPVGVVTQYTIVALDALGQQSSGANSVNNSGQIVGYAAFGPAFWTNSSSPAVALTMLSGRSFSTAIGINESGQIVGYDGQADQTTHAAFWTNNGSGEVDLGTFGPADWPGLRSGAYGINGSGQVVGYGSGHFQQGDYEYYFGGAAYWTNSSAAPLLLINADGTSGGYAFAINDSGVVVGSTAWPEAMVWTNVHAPALALNNGDNCQAMGINASGQIVGLSLFGSATFWADYLSPRVSLNQLAGSSGETAQSINASGQIVGWSSGQAGDHAVLWANSASQPIDLNSFLPANSGWVLSQAYAINDSGEIVGFGAFNDQTRAFALIPSALAPALRITSVLRSADDLKFSFISQVGHTYNVLTTSDLTTGTWSTLQTGIPGNGGTVSVTIQNVFVAPRQFFRIQQAQ